MLYVSVSAVVLLLTSVLVKGEPLRQIQGTVFPFLWILMLAFLLVIADYVIKAIVRIYHEKLFARLNELTITHTEIPHLMKFPYCVIESGYYLLRLYLQGIVRFEGRTRQTAEGETEHVSSLMLDEERLEEIKAKGGRHSKAAINMVRFLRDNRNCSISDVLMKSFSNEDDDDPMHLEIRKAIKQSWQVTGIVLAAALGLAGGVLIAKLELGLENGKAVGYLGLLLLLGVMAAPNLWSWRQRKVHEDDDSQVENEIKGKLRERPHQINKGLIARVNESLPYERERNSILNAYFLSWPDLRDMARGQNEMSFMSMFVNEHIRAQEKLIAKAKAEAAHLAQSDSGCSSCGSCSSCGGCSGCGGCGGCGD